MGCVDLRPWATENSYKWRYEEGYPPGVGRDEDECFVEVLCKYGLLYPYGGDIILAYANSGVKERVRKLPGITHHQYDGNNEVFRCPSSLLDEVATIIQPRKKRTLDPEKARAIGRGTAYRPANEAKNARSGDAPTTTEGEGQ